MRRCNIKIYAFLPDQLVNTRTELTEGIETAKESSLDYYLFVQGAYTQHRRGVLYVGNPPEEQE